MSTYAMFTLDEACTFLEEKLRVQNPRERRTSDRRRLLDDVTSGLQHLMPFTNVHMMSPALEERRRPTLEEMKANILSGAGGVCYDLNAASHYLLKALGFDVYFTLAVFIEPVPCHLLNLVKDVEKPGDEYIIDSGCGYPTLRAVSLDFEEESPAYEDSFLEYKFAKRDGKIHRLHGKGDSKDRDGIHSDDTSFIGGWRRLYVIDPSTATKNLEDFNDVFHEVFTDPGITPLLQTFKCLGYAGKKAVFISNEKILAENTAGELEMTRIEGGDEGILSAVSRYYPDVPLDITREALVRWRDSKVKSEYWGEGA